MSADEFHLTGQIGSGIGGISEDCDIGENEHFLLNHQPQITQPPNSLDLDFKCTPEIPPNRITNVTVSHPINIVGASLTPIINDINESRSVIISGEVGGNGSSTTSGIAGDGGYGSSYATSYNYKKPIIESEMSGEASTHFFSSPNTFGEVREIRAGCRRIRDERPGFSIITSFNEDLLKFLQDEKQHQMNIDDVQEYDKILELAKLYSLNIQIKNGCIILNKTANTMQAVRVSKEQNNLTRYFRSDYKRRCVGGDTE